MSTLARLFASAQLSNHIDQRFSMQHKHGCICCVTTKGKSRSDTDQAAGKLLASSGRTEH